MTTVKHGYRSVAHLFVFTASLCLAATGASAELGDVVGLTLGPSNTGTFGSTVHVLWGNRLVVPDGTDNIYVYDANRSLINTLTTPEPETLGWLFGFSTAPMGNLLLTSDIAPPWSQSASTPNRVHVLNVDTGERLRSFVSPRTQFDHFGSSLSYQPGLDKVFVGAHAGLGSNDLMDLTAGDVYAFDRNLGTENYSLTTDLNPLPGFSSLDIPNFGFSVTNSRQTLAVGAPHATHFGFSPSYTPNSLGDPYSISYNYNHLSSSLGSLAEVHLYDAPTGEFIRSIPSPNAGQNYVDLFGTQLATTDKTVYISASKDAALGIGVGAVYAYDVLTGTMQHQFLPPVSHGATLFGWATKVYGDYLFVGAPEFDGGSDFFGNPIWTNSGAVFIYNRHTGELVKTIENPTPNNGDNFGRAIEVVGTRLFVGAPFDDGGGVNAGAVHEFDLGNLSHSKIIDSDLGTAIGRLFEGAATPGGIDITFGGLNGTGEVSGQLLPGTPDELNPFTTPDGNPAMWSLAFTGVADDFALTFGYDDTGLGTDEARLGLWQFLGLDPATDPTNWVLLGLADASSNTITVQTDSLGTFALGVQPVPEPSTIMLLASGLLLRTRKRDRSH